MSFGDSAGDVLWDAWSRLTRWRATAWIFIGCGAVFGLTLLAQDAWGWWPVIFRSGLGLRWGYVLPAGAAALVAVAIFHRYRKKYFAHQAVFHGKHASYDAEEAIKPLGGGYVALELGGTTGEFGLPPDEGTVFMHELSYIMLGQEIIAPFTPEPVRLVERLEPEMVEGIDVYGLKPPFYQLHLPTEISLKDPEATIRVLKQRDTNAALNHSRQRLEDVVKAGTVAMSHVRRLRGDARGLDVEVTPNFGGSQRENR